MESVLFAVGMAVMVDLTPGFRIGVVTVGVGYFTTIESCVSIVRSDGNRFDLFGFIGPLFEHNRAFRLVGGWGSVRFSWGVIGLRFMVPTMGSWGMVGFRLVVPRGMVRLRLVVGGRWVIGLRSGMISRGFSKIPLLGWGWGVGGILEGLLIGICMQMTRPGVAGVTGVVRVGHSIGEMKVLELSNHFGGGGVIEAHGIDPVQFDPHVSGFGDLTPGFGGYLIPE